VSSARDGENLQSNYTRAIYKLPILGIIVFTKSVTSKFSRVLIGSRNSEYPWLFTVLFCDWSQDGVSFEDIFERRNFCDK